MSCCTMQLPNKEIEIYETASCHDTTNTLLCTHGLQ